MLGINPAMYPQKLISALVAADFSNQYYLLCREHPYRAALACKYPHPEVIKTLEGLGEVAKLRGPGRVYTVRTPEQHRGIEFSFMIQGAGTSLEPCLSIADAEKPNGSNFAVLAFYASKADGKTAQIPPYPRPSFYSPFELREVVHYSFNLAINVGRSFYA